MTHPVDEAFSGFLQLMARLWRARWFVIGIAALFAILTFINLKFIALETFRSEAILYLAEEVEPPILETLLKNPEMLDVVRKRFLERFPEAKGVAQMEKFKRRFQMDQVILEDNSLRKRYSPALTLSADAHSAEEAQALASIWLEEVTARFGGASGLEAQFKVQHARELLDDLKSKESQSVSAR